jgi:NTP pyrophosphatase (non-canonical NTP hydrolase)
VGEDAVNQRDETATDLVMQALSFSTVPLMVWRSDWAKFGVQTEDGRTLSVSVEDVTDGGGLTVSDAERRVWEFHRKYGFAINDMSRTSNELRADLIMEEAKEAAEAIRLNDRPGMAKELADVVVVSYGAAITMGIDLDLATYLVHESNMTKTPGNLRGDGKLLKGPSYRPPDMTPALWPPRWWTMHPCTCEKGPRGGIALVDITCPDHGAGGRWPL